MESLDDKAKDADASEVEDISNCSPDKKTRKSKKPVCAVRTKTKGERGEGRKRMRRRRRGRTSARSGLRFDPLPTSLRAHHHLTSGTGSCYEEFVRRRNTNTEKTQPHICTPCNPINLAQLSGAESGRERGLLCSGPGLKKQLPWLFAPHSSHACCACIKITYLSGFQTVEGKALEI